jgi:hypothetical protein
MARATRKATADKVTAAERQKQAMELRKAGASYSAIAERVGYASESGARKAVATVLARIVAEANESAGELRAMTLERLDAMILAIWPACRRGDLGAIDRVLRIEAQRAKLLGLDAPERVDVAASVRPGEEMSADEALAILRAARVAGLGGSG